jgi:hypothetical protein
MLMMRSTVDRHHDHGAQQSPLNVGQELPRMRFLIADVAVLAMMSMATSA